MNKQLHIPVLKEEVIKNLHIKENGIYVDCTAGYGGHSCSILNNLGNNGHLICIDQDLDAIKYLKSLFKKKKNVDIINTNFCDLDKFIDKKVDGIIFDLGISSLMVDNPKRGFSYMKNGPLDMRMNKNNTLTVSKIINSYPKSKLIDIFYKYGQTDHTVQVVNKIIECRKSEYISSTKQLSNLICNCFNGNQNRKHPAKKYFQALRIVVNDEINCLNQALNKAIKLLKINGYLLVISFHSIEDKLVKNLFRKITSVNDKYDQNIPLTSLTKPKFELITKKPIIPTNEEISNNHRSHSAKLRIIRRSLK